MSSRQSSVMSYDDPDSRLLAFNHELEKIPDKKFLGVILFEIQKRHENYFKFINLRMYNRILDQLYTQGFTWQDFGIDNNDRWQEYNIQLNAGGPRRQYYIFAVWALGKEFNNLYVNHLYSENAQMFLYFGLTL